MGIDLDKLRIKSFSVPQAYEIQNAALLSALSDNSIFQTPVIATGDQFSSGQLGDTPEQATKPVITGGSTNHGPTVEPGTNTQQIIDTLSSNINGFFINSEEFPDRDSIESYLTGEIPKTSNIFVQNVCVLDGQLTDETPTVSRNKAEVLQAYTDVFGVTRVDENKIDPRVYTLDGPFSLTVSVVFAGDPVTEQTTTSLIEQSSTDFPTFGFGFGGGGFGGGGFGGGGFGGGGFGGGGGGTTITSPTTTEKNTVRNAIDAIDIVKSCNVGEYHPTFQKNQFFYVAPYRLDEPLDVTGYTYIDDNQQTGTISDAVLPTDRVISQVTYSSGSALFSTLNSKLTPAGQQAISNMQFDISIRNVELGTPSGDIISLSTDDKRVVGAINELDQLSNQAVTDAGNVEKSVWVSGVGDWRNSQVLEIDDPNDITGATMINPNFDQISYDALTGINPEWNSMIAWRKLNLIPVLLKDKILTAKEYVDPEDETATITRLELDQNSQVNLLEATFSLWRHISADTTNTYGISALTDPELQPDGLIEPLSAHSFINIFNSLYTDLSGLSADLSTHKFAISGDTDQLIEALSGNSVYTNLNNIYTGLSALSAEDFDVACCDVLQLSAAELSAQTTTLSSDLSALSGYVMDLDLTGGGGGGTTELPCDNICEDIEKLKGPIISDDHPGGFDVPFPGLDDDGNPRPFVPDGKIPTEGGPAGVEPGTVVYKTIVDKKEYIIYKKAGGDWTADGPFDDDTPRHYDGPGITITGGSDTGPTGGTLPEPFPQQPPITERSDPFPEWREKLEVIREVETKVTEVETKVTDLEQCCGEFREYIATTGDPTPPNGFDIPDFTPTDPDDPDGPDTPLYHPVPGGNPDDPDNPNEPVIMPTDNPPGGIVVPGPEADDPKTYTPVPPDDPNRPPDDGVAPGTTIYKYITQEGETKYIYKHIITNKWVQGDNPGDPDDPGTPLGDPADDTGGVITKRPDGGIDVPYPPGGPKKPYQPIPDDDPTKPTNVCPDSVVYKYVDPATNTVQFVYCDASTGEWVIGGNPDNPDSPKLPLDPPSGGTTTVINSLSSLVDNNIIQIETLSGCCVDNGTALSALSAVVYGAGPEPDTFVDDLTGSIVFNINTLYGMITGDDAGGETDSLQVTINKTNITTLSADLTSLSADITSLSADLTSLSVTDTTQLSADVISLSANSLELSACCDTNRFNIDLNNTTLTDKITSIETQIGTLGDNYVDLTDFQTISGEKVFEDDFTVSAPADFTDNVTIGVGDTIFKCCTLPTGLTQVQIPNLPEEGIDDLDDLPDDSLYITDISGTKVLAIKSS